VIPTVILAGFIAGLFGRRGWWFVAVAAIAWPLLLVATDADSGFAFLVSAAALGAVNAAVGVGFGHMVHLLVAKARLRV